MMYTICFLYIYIFGMKKKKKRNNLIHFYNCTIYIKHARTKNPPHPVCEEKGGLFWNFYFRLIVLYCAAVPAFGAIC